jgi:hypothetical protein
MSLGTTMNDADRPFAQGRANPAKFEWPVRSSAGAAPDPQRSEDAAALLGRPASFVDANGYECEIIGAAVNDVGDVSYVESREKDVGGQVDISIKIHLVKKGRPNESADIESYNPFFGCALRFFEWIGAAAVLIYREKHCTFACRLGDVWPPRFVEIEHDWVIDGDILGYVGYKEAIVRRLSFPALDVLDPIPASEAVKVGLFPAAEERYNQTLQRTGAAPNLVWHEGSFRRGPGR